MLTLSRTTVVSTCAAVALSSAAVALLCASMALSSCSTPDGQRAGRNPLRHPQLLDDDWRFHRGEVGSSNDVIAVNCAEERDWQTVQVPHDYQLDGTYQPEVKTGKTSDSRRRGYLPVEVAWYRKHFVIPQSDAGKTLQLEFAGVFRNCKVWLNGEYLGGHEGGYTGFFFDITKAARPGADNVLVVKVDPRKREGWWYEGSGIYRHVSYMALPPVHVAKYGTYVVSNVRDGDKGAAEQAEVTVETTVENNGSSPANCTIVSEVLAPNGAVIESLRTEQAISAKASSRAVQQTLLKQPRLWSVESPQLYQLRTTILQAGKPVDSTMTTFGIRTIRFDAEKGFFLNGKHVRIQGVACHQDFPAVGIAMPDSLDRWRVKKLKEIGCNGWRTAHNEVNEALLDACDQMGMLVMAENRHLDDSEANLADLATMIQHDRNHPSIIMWSLCNEGGVQGKPEGARLFAALKKAVLRYDKTRLTTSAMNKGWMEPGQVTAEDMIGVNYHPEAYDEIHRAHPTMPMFGSETANTKTTRGEYANDPVNGWVSGYNLVDAKAGEQFSPGICIDGWPAVASRAFMAGSYTWAGFDYKGEPNPYGWPMINSNVGLMDSCGFPKDKYFYLQGCWSDKPMVHLMPTTWNWPGKEGQNIRVIAFSNAGEVELLLNGKSLGKQAMPKDGFIEWQVPYQPGQLTARATIDGKLVATEQLETTDEPSSIQISPDRQILAANVRDTVVVPVSILDAKGRIVPYAKNRVSFQLSGNGLILGVGNGNPSDHDPDRASERNAFHGRCIVILQAGAKKGPLQLMATSPGLKPATVAFQVK